MSGNAAGRPRLHASNAARQAAYRQTKSTVTITSNQAESIARIAAQLDQSSAEVLRSMIRFALTNRNWTQLGLLPTSESKA